MARVVLAAWLIILMLPISALAKVFLVKMKSFNSMSAWQFYQDHYVRVLEAYEPGLLLKVSVEDDFLEQGYFSLTSLPDVEYVVENVIFQIPRVQITSSSVSKRQYGLQLIQAPLAWNLAGSKGGGSIKVAVIDTGVDYRHPNLAGNVLPGYDFYDNDSDPMDVTGFINPGHGTHVAGIIGANEMVDDGVLGVIPQVKLIPIRFLGANGGGDLLMSVKAIDYALAQGATVINASWGAMVKASAIKPLLEAIERSYQKDVVFVAAAGNEKSNNDRIETYPANASFENVITVAATNERDEMADFSNFGIHKVHIAAPGENILSTLPRNRYGELSGTSMAAPMVAGAAAFIRALRYNLKAGQIRSLLQATGDALAKAEVACQCRLNLARAVEYLQQNRVWLHPYTLSVPVGQSVRFTAVGGQGPFAFRLLGDSSYGTITSHGVFTALRPGEVRVEVVDQRGEVAQSGVIRILSRSRP